VVVKGRRQRRGEETRGGMISKVEGNVLGASKEFWVRSGVGCTLSLLIPIYASRSLTQLSNLGPQLGPLTIFSAYTSLLEEPLDPSQIDERAEVG
jgi:hypothetical protein